MDKQERHPGKNQTGALSAIKTVLGKLPYTAEAYWLLRQQGRAPYAYFSLQGLEKHLPSLRDQALAAAQHPAALEGDTPVEPQRIVIFAMLRKWIEHAALLGMALGGLGHKPTLLYLPYAAWDKHLNEFDQRRQNAYARKVLSQTAPVFPSISMLDIKLESAQQESRQSMPVELLASLQDVALRDTQYTLQIEDFDLQGDTPAAHLYQMRLEYNLRAANAFLAWINDQAPDQRPQVVLTPNGSILEMGALYQAARWLGLPVVTYEFGEQRDRIWLAHNSQVMLQETGDLWSAYQSHPGSQQLSQQELDRIQALYAARHNAQLWQNFVRQWQGTPRQGGEQVRQALGLDDRPVILLAANVICDSLTLGRQIFTANMTEWLQRTAQSFLPRENVQLVIRIHPGERYSKGPSVAEVVRAALPEIPSHIHLVQALDPINTYDIIQIAEFGLAYTTTVGMEMAMSGVPVILGGATHYRGKGFTCDPTTWDEFDRLLDEMLAAPERYRLTRDQVEQAWRYAYRFFFNYPCPFPWHYQQVWKEVQTWPLSRVLSAEGQALFGRTFRYLAGEPRHYLAEIEAEQAL
jgi:hypothetical protein